MGAKGLGVLLAGVVLALTPGSSSAAGTAAPSCASAVTSTVGHIAQQFYRHETLGRDAHDSVVRVERSPLLRDAVVSGDAAGALAAIAGLNTAKQIARIRVFHGSQLLADVGQHAALAPIRGPLRDLTGHQIGHFELSMRADFDFIARLAGLVGAEILIRSPTAQIMGTLDPGPPTVPSRGLVRYAGASYDAYTFAAQSYPSGPLEISVLVPIPDTVRLCGGSTAETVANTVGEEGRRIYSSEISGPDVDYASNFIGTASDMLGAVMRWDPVGVRAAIVRFFRTTIHIVRVRVTRGGVVLKDLGGPAVLAPVSGSFYDGSGQVIGEYLFSVQDDAGYIKEATEWTGAQVVMAMRGHRIASSLRPGPGLLPSRGSVRYGGVDYQVFSFMATAFPSGPLRISLLVRPGAFL